MPEGVEDEMAQAKDRPDYGHNDQALKNRRWGSRTPMQIPVQLDDILGSVISANVLNMSDEGMMIETAQVYQFSTNVLYTLKIEGFLNSQCLPIWCSEQYAGLAFSLPIHPAVVAALARRFPAGK